MGRRDLDAWANALGARNDIDAIGRLAAVSGAVRALQEEYATVCDRLRGVDERGLAARLADEWDTVGEELFWVKRDFLLHERGL